MKYNLMSKDNLIVPILEEEVQNAGSAESDAWGHAHVRTHSTSSCKNANIRVSALVVALSQGPIFRVTPLATFISHRKC